MKPTKPPPRPCECGCGVLLAQKAKGSPRRFWSDACAERVRKAKEEEAAEERAVRALKQRLRYATESNREKCAAHREKHRDGYNAAHRAYWAANRERLNAIRRARRAVTKAA